MDNIMKYLVILIIIILYYILTIIFTATIIGIIIASDCGWFEVHSQIINKL